MAGATNPPEQGLEHSLDAARSNTESQDCAGVPLRRITEQRLAELRWLARQWKGTGAGAALEDALALLDLSQASLARAIRTAFAADERARAKERA